MQQRRRQLLAGAGAFLASPQAWSQAPKRVWVIGILSPRARPTSLDKDANFLWFQRGMQELGYVESKNIRFESRFAAGQMDRLPGLASELVALKVDVIVAAGNQSITAARKATATIPIVIATAIDPVGSGFAKSLARPGENVTGLSNLTSEISVKHLEMLAAILPRLALVAILHNPTNTAHAVVRKSLRDAARDLRIQVTDFEASSEAELEPAFAAMAKQRAEAVVVAVDGLFSLHASQVARLARKHALPTIYANSALAEAGGLLGYGQNFADNYFRAATYVDKILKGAKPGDLPIEQSTKFELTINMKTARALGITIPKSIQVRADTLIE